MTKTSLDLQGTTLSFSFQLSCLLLTFSTSECGSAPALPFGHPAFSLGDCGDYYCPVHQMYLPLWLPSAPFILYLLYLARAMWLVLSMIVSKSDTRLFWTRISLLKQTLPSSLPSPCLIHLSPGVRKVGQSSSQTRWTYSIKKKERFWSYRPLRVEADSLP